MGLAEDTDCRFVSDKTTWVDKRGKKRVVPMRLLCFGLSRTGTASLRMALWELGYKPYHGFAIFENPPDATLADEAMRGKYEGKGKKPTKEDFDALFYDCDATLDQPGTLFVQELVTAYPSAKIMVTIRDFDSWFASVKSTILCRDNKPTWASIVLLILDPTIRLIFSELLLSDRLLYGKRSWTRTREELQVIWDEHMKRVYDAAGGREKVFHFNVKDGWLPLCAFLESEVPKSEHGKMKPFPHVNDSAAFNDVIGSYLVKLAKKRLTQAGSIVAVVAAVSIGLHRVRS